MTIIGRPAPQFAPAATTQIAAAARQDGGRPKARFADVFDGLVKPCNGEPGFLGNADDGASGSASGDEAQTASVFNSHGLFHNLDAQGGSNGQPATPAIASVPTVDEAAAVAALDWSRGRTDEPAPAPDVTIEAVVRSPMDRTTPTQPIPGSGGVDLRSARIATTTPEIVPTKPSPSADTEPEPLTITARARPRFAPALRDVGAENRVAVSLRTTELGQIVVARADDLDRAERTKLRDRIVGFLARHGLAAHAVHITGRSAAPDFKVKER